MAKRNYYARAKFDFKDLKQLRKPRDKRRRPLTPEQEEWRRLWIKISQFSLALHRKGLASPYDYTYPDLNSMSALAKVLHERHIQPLLNKAGPFSNTEHRGIY